MNNFQRHQRVYPLALFIGLLITTSIITTQAQSIEEANTQAREATMLYESRAEPEKAISLYQAAIKTYKEEQVWLAYIETNARLIKTLSRHDMSQAQTTLEELHRFLEEEKKLSPQEYAAGMADVYHHRAFFLHRQGVYTLEKATEVINLYLQSLTWRQAINKIEAVKKAQTHHNLGVLYRNFSRYDESISHATTCLNLYLQFDTLQGKGYLELGGRYYDAGDLKQALPYLEAASKSTLDLRRRTFLYNNMALAYVANKQYQKALDYYQKAIRVRIEQMDLDETHAEIVETYRNMGAAYTHTSDYEQALRVFQKAITGFQQADNYEQLANTYAELGIMYKHQGDYDEALRMFDKAINLRQEHSIVDPIRLGGIYENIGDVYVLQGKLDKALESDQQALIHLVAEFNETALEQNPKLNEQRIDDRELLLIALASKASTLRKHYQKTQDTATLAPDPSHLSLRHQW